MKDFDYLTASRSGLTSACVLTVVAESLFAEVFDTYSRSSSLSTESGISVSGKNRDEPFSQAIHLPFAATFQW